MASAGRRKAPKTGLRGTRRRLSVVSDNRLIEGLQALGAVPDETIQERRSEHVVKCYAGLSKKGYAPYNPRKRNQDAIMMVEHAPTNSLLFGVLDGHGEAGDLVSHYFTDRLSERVFGHSKFKSDPNRAVAEELDKIERSLLADASIDTEFSGTTAVVACIRNRTLTVANVGDSRIILGRRSSSGRYEAVEVSIDHKPDRPDEQKRIEACGGRVFAVEYDDGVDGPPRVWLGHMDIPGLAMARSLGDTVAHTAGVISEPELFTKEISSKDKILVMASDGLWEFMSNQEVIDMIAGIKEPKKAVDILIKEAGERWMKEEQVIDDTTVIVAYF